MEHLQDQIETFNDLVSCVETYKKYKPKYFSFDTETDGLNIRFNNPFLIVFGFATEDAIYTYSLDLDKADRSLVDHTMKSF